jgi:hypothetical protein
VRSLILRAANTDLWVAASVQPGPHRGGYRLARQPEPRRSDSHRSRGGPGPRGRARQSPELSSAQTSPGGHHAGLLHPVARLGVDRDRTGHPHEVDGLPDRCGKGGFAHTEARAGHDVRRNVAHAREQEPCCVEVQVGVRRRVRCVRFPACASYSVVRVSPCSNGLSW